MTDRPQWLYRLTVQRLEMLTESPTPEEVEIIGRHFAYVKEKERIGDAIFFGRTTDDGPQTFGIVVFEANDEDAARALMEADPAVAEGVMAAELFPFRVAGIRAPDGRGGRLPARDRARGALLGLAVGDAVGTTLEFQRRGSFDPVTDMTGGGPFGLVAGQWTDDTSMALCLAASLLEVGFDLEDQIERYCMWAQDGYLSSTGTCFDIGGTVSDALHFFQKTGEAEAGSTDERSAGNGSIMRLAPVVLYYWPDAAAACARAIESSKTTHGTAECLDACRMLAEILCAALAGQSKDAVLSAPTAGEGTSDRLRDVAKGTWRDKSEDEIRGSGYVVESLEAALWCFARSETFEEAILAAANLGDDADTTAAVCGQIAGAFHGESGIPDAWLSRLTMGDDIGMVAERLNASTP